MDDLSKITSWLFGRFFSKAEDESTWEPIHEHTPGEVSAKTMAGHPPPRLAAE